MYNLSEETSNDEFTSVCQPIQCVYMYMCAVIYATYKYTYYGSRMEWNDSSECIASGDVRHSFSSRWLTSSQQQKKKKKNRKA